MHRMRFEMESKGAHSPRGLADAEIVAEELSLLFDGVQGHAICLVDAAGKVSTWNRGAQRLIGWSEQEAVGSEAAFFYPPDAIVAGKPAEHLAEAVRYGRLEAEE